MPGSCILSLTGRSLAAAAEGGTLVAAAPLPLCSRRGLAGCCLLRSSPPPPPPPPPSPLLPLPRPPPPPLLLRRLLALAPAGLLSARRPRMAPPAGDPALLPPTISADASAKMLLSPAPRLLQAAAGALQACGLS
jgi:hypothetical protein